MQDGRTTKVPYDPVTGKRAETDKPETFRDFNAALAAVNKYDGIGFLVGDRICALDLDDCFEENGGMKPWAQDIADMFSGCYMELSPSGKGVRIIFLAFNYSYDKAKYYINNRALGLEVYVAGATNRFVTLTGNIYREGEVLEKAETLKIVLDKYMQRPALKPMEAPVSESRSFLSDESVIEKASSAANGEKFKALWRGDISGYASHSEADLGLCCINAFWCGKDALQMDRLFRQSGLYRDKWDRAQSGSTYGWITIEKAIAGTTAVYCPIGKMADAKDDFADNISREPDFEPWADITPIDQIITPEFPLECFPETIGNYARALSEYTQTDPAMSGVALLGLLGTLFQNKISVISVNGNIEQTSIYALIIAPPAERKSEDIRCVIRPVNKFVDEYNMKRRAEMSRSKAERKLLEKNLAKAEKGGDIDELFKAQEALDNFREIKPLTLVADDTTVEALISLMAENDERMLIASDEGGIFTHMKGRYKQNGDDTELYLKAHSGGRVSIHRKSREPETLKSPALSLIIAAQPYVVDNSILEEENNGRGLTARLVYAVCGERAGSRKAISEDMPTGVVEQYESSVKNCLSKTINSEAFLGNDYSTVGYVRLSDEAREYAIQYFDVTEKRIAEGLGRAKGWNGKAFGLSIRIAGIFHAFESMEQDKDPSEIPLSLRVMENAAKVTDCLAVHAEKVFTGNDKKNSDALYLLKRIKEMDDEFSKQDLWQKARRRFPNAEAFDEALQVLERGGYIRIEVHQTKGRPVFKIKVNPSIKCT